MTAKRDRLVGERVAITWEDSAGSGGGWISEHAVKDHGPSTCQTCGFLVARDHRKIQVSLSRAVTKGMMPWSDLVSIPMSAVRSLHKVTRMRRVKKLP